MDGVVIPEIDTSSDTEETRLVEDLHFDSLSHNVSDKYSKYLRSTLQGLTKLLKFIIFYRRVV